MSRRKNQRRQGVGPSRADFEKRRNYQVLLTGLQTMAGTFEAKKEREQQARRAWTGGAEPPRAELGHWREDSVGDRFFSQKEITDAVGAPRLAEVKLPHPQQIAENSGHWAVAVSVLIRAVALDGVPAVGPAVAPALDLLLPAVHDELAVEAGMDDTDFAETSAPLFLLGTCALTDATWAIVGLDPLDQSLALMERRIDDALAEVAARTAFPAGKAVAEALIRAFAGQYQCAEPSDVRTLERLGRSASGNPLIDLIQAKEVAPRDALRLGLIVLAALADLARTDADSAAGHE